MLKKGKFKLSSFLIENNLIFFKSSNKNDDIIAFAVLKSPNFVDFIPELTKMLKKRYFYYFSWQIDIKKNRDDFFIICFRDTKKAIIKSFNLVKESLKNYDFNQYFLLRESLQNFIFGLLSPDLNSRISIDKKKNKIKIKNEKQVWLLDVFELNLDNFTRNNNLFLNFINYLFDTGKDCSLIFNFDIEKLNLVTYHIIFINRQNKEDSSKDFNQQVNKFFNLNLLKITNLRLKDIMLLVWREKLSSSKSFNKVPIFSPNIEKNAGFALIYKELEQILNENKLKYHRINHNIFFIEDSLLFYFIDDLNLEILSKFLKKFYKKYKINLVFLNDEEYRRIQQTDQISNLKALKILRLNDLKRLKFNILNAI